MFDRSKRLRRSLAWRSAILVSAFLVGIILMWTLKRTNRARIQSEVQEYIRAAGQNFLRAVYGRELPREMFEVI